MRIKPDTDNKGYQLWLSANDTYNWAHRPNKSWPCSTLSNHRCYIAVDSNGLVDLTVDGQYPVKIDIDGNELSAIVSDHLPKELRHLWPIWQYFVI